LVLAPNTTIIFEKPLGYISWSLVMGLYFLLYYMHPLLRVYYPNVISYLRAMYVIKRPSVEMRFSGQHACYAISFSVKCVVCTQVRRTTSISQRTSERGARREISICRTARFGNQQIGSHRTPADIRLL
jgi:hypothetical protein